MNNRLEVSMRVVSNPGFNSIWHVFIGHTHTHKAPTGVLKVPGCKAAEDVEIFPQVLFPSLGDHGQQSDQHQYSSYQHHYVRVRLEGSYKL